VQITVVGDGDGGLLQLFGARNLVVDAVCAVAQGVLVVTVQVNE
jgi:hypothetical protein